VALYQVVVLDFTLHVPVCIFGTRHLRNKLYQTPKHSVVFDDVVFNDNHTEHFVVFNDVVFNDNHTEHFVVFNNVVFNDNHTGQTDTCSIAAKCR
jgi:hypothetical protein